MQFPRLKISDRYVGKNYPPLIIAEIGINHGGKIDVAKSMVYDAFRAGAEIIKHQTHFVDDEMTSHAKNIFPPNDNRSIWEIMDVCSLSPDKEIELKNFTEQLGMIYLSTPFSRKAVDFLDDIGIHAFKIGSGEADNLPLVDHIASKRKPIILSTGMQTIDSLKETVEVIKGHKCEYALLECTNLYPSSPEYVSLKGITSLEKSYPEAVIGFSDHSIGPYMSIAALGKGASIIERHFTDSRYRKGPDIQCSMDPAELRLLVNIAKEIWVANSNEKQMSVPEKDVYKFARGSVVYDKNLKAGTCLTKEDIWTRRPGSGEIAAIDFYKLIGKKLIKDVSYNDQAQWRDFE